MGFQITGKKIDYKIIAKCIDGFTNIQAYIPIYNVFIQNLGNDHVPVPPNSQILNDLIPDDEWSDSESGSESGSDSDSGSESGSESEKLSDEENCGSYGSSEDDEKTLNNFVFRGKFNKPGVPESSRNPGCKKEVFVKLIPIIDPIIYLTNRVKETDYLSLPSRSTTDVTNSALKPMMVNNSAYVDGFFILLTSILLADYKFANGIDYYGSFLGIKSEYKVNVIDDIDDIMESEYFKENLGDLFEMDDEIYKLLETKYDEIENESDQETHDGCVTKKPLLKIDDECSENILEMGDIDDMVADIDKEIIDDKNTINIISDSDNDNIKDEYSNINANIDHPDISKYTLDCLDNLDNLDEIGCDKIKLKTHSESSESEWSESSDVVPVTIHNCPVQATLMECCDETLYGCICDSELQTDEWMAIFMQIIMNLLTYQKAFQFTHNDLHIDNIMCIKTSEKYLYYVYNGIYYKVPSFGRILKIIDFGRAIYTFNGTRICGDCYEYTGEAGKLYNTEPYFSENEPRIEPNYSFDLCRLSCSLVDIFFERENFNKETIDSIISDNPVAKIVYEWCTDDSEQCVLYNAKGKDRYPGFDLYKMIARTVHYHSPENQLKRAEFSQFQEPKSQIKTKNIINIDKIVKIFASPRPK